MLVFRTVEQSLFLSRDAWPPPPPPSSCGTELRLSRGRLQLFMLQTRDTKTPQFKFKWRRKLGDGVKSRKKGKRGMRRSSKSRTRDATQQNPVGYHWATVQVYIHRSVISHPFKNFVHTVTPYNVFKNLRSFSLLMYAIWCL